MKPMNNIPVQINNLGCCNVVYGSIKFVNIHYQAMQLDGTLQDENFYCGTKNQLPQSLTIDNCLFEYSNVCIFDCSHYSVASVAGLMGRSLESLIPISATCSMRANGGDQEYSSAHYPIDTFVVENRL